MFLFFSCFALFCFTSVQMFVGVTCFRCGQGLLQCRVENSRRAAPVWRGSVGLVVALAFLLYPLTALLLPHPPYLPAPLVTSPQASFPISPSPLVGFQCWICPLNSFGFFLKLFLKDIGLIIVSLFIVLCLDKWLFFTCFSILTR